MFLVENYTTVIRVRFDEKRIFTYSCEVALVAQHISRIRLNAEEITCRSALTSPTTAAVRRFTASVCVCAPVRDAPSWQLVAARDAPNFRSSSRSCSRGEIESLKPTIFARLFGVVRKLLPTQ